MQEDKISSATTAFTKTYIEGGTTPDSEIVIKKPKPNYTAIGILGIIGVYLIYIVFLNKQSK
jgi:hypothetical protein